MSDELSFVDTNVLVYAVSRDEPEKQVKARAILERGFADGCYVISTQVLLELYVNVTQKAKIRLPPREALDYAKALTQWPVIETNTDLVLAAFALADRAKISVWDAAIVEAARVGGCRRVLSEDLGSGHSYGGVMVENPFL
jgi:predicted nucleic acid-binding protein